MWIGFRVILTFTFVWLAPELGRTDNHQVALGLDGGHPAIARVLAGIRRANGTRLQAKTAILTEDLRRLVRALPATPGRGPG